MIERARIVKAADLGGTVIRDGRDGATAHPTPATRAVRIPSAVVDARAEAARIVAAARAEAARIEASARDAASDAAKRARDEATAEAEARAAARHLALRDWEAKREDRALERTVELAVILAERLLQEELARDPARLVALARTALGEARGARRIRIEVRPEDEPRLRAALVTLGHEHVEMVPNPALEHGSLVLDTDVGTVDARLRPQLERLSGALRAALAEVEGR